ncbi:MAG: hypothetical protein D6722_02445 [Bacteroidetes bacterium]|nr:MAG: hypothetical protein D6722_02445 [Bacteroidota bacterium]
MRESLVPMNHTRNNFFGQRIYLSPPDLMYREFWISGERLFSNRLFIKYLNAILSQPEGRQ